MTPDNLDADDALLQMERKLWAWADVTGHGKALGEDAIHELAALILAEVRGAVGRQALEEVPEAEMDPPDDDGVPF